MAALSVTIPPAAHQGHNNVQFLGGDSCADSYEVANKPVRDIEIYLELQKSHVDKETGRIWVRGIASDNSVDFQNDIVEISKIGTSLSILNRGWGKFNFEHHDEKVGEITKVAFITPQEAFAKYGVECTGTVLELEGFIYAVTEKTPEKSDVRELHKLIDVGARLGFSLQGGIVQRIPVKGKDSKTYMVAVPSFVNLCAITTQPVNMNTICLPFAKSLAAVLCEGGLSEAEWSMVDEANHSANGVNKPAPLLFMGDGFGNGSVDALIKSAVGAALSSSGGQALVGALGGDSIRSGAVDAKATGTVVDEAATGSQCSRCNCAVTKATKFCPECGVMQPELRKSLQRATAGFSSSFENAFEHRLDLVSAARGFQEAFAL